MHTATGERSTSVLAIDRPGWTFFAQASAESLPADSSMNLQGRADNH